MEEEQVHAKTIEGFISAPPSPRNATNPTALLLVPKKNGNGSCAVTMLLYRN